MNIFFYSDIIFSKQLIFEIKTDFSFDELITYLKNKASLEQKNKIDIHFDCFEIKINERTFYSFRTSTFLDDSKIKKSLVFSINDIYDKIKLVKKIETMIINSEDLI